MKIKNQNQHAVTITIPRDQAFALQAIGNILSGEFFYGGANPSKWSKEATRAIFALKNKMPSGEYPRTRNNAKDA